MQTKRTAVVGLALVAVTTVVVTAGCVGSTGPVTTIPPTTMRVGNTDVYSYQLVCPSAVGDLSTNLQFTVTDSIENVTSGETVTYTIQAPLAQVKAPVTPTFVNSTTTYAIPAGFQATSAVLDPTSNSDFPTTTVNIVGQTVVSTINGSFPLDGTPRTVPALKVTGTITAQSGQDITWQTPQSVVGEASVPILGNQTSTCSFPTSGTIGSTNVV
jgi:hypothetical protein